jgi:hypothetical protein
MHSTHSIHSKLLWSIHNASKAIVNAMILVRIAASRQILSIFLWSTAYELLFDPLTLSLANRGHSNNTSLLAHHMMVFAWAMAMTMANGPRTWVIATIAANRIVIYGAAAARGMHWMGVSGNILAHSTLPVIIRKRSVVVRAFLSTFQFVAAVLDGFAVLLYCYQCGTTIVTPLQVAIAASQFGVVTGLSIFHLRLASKRYGVLLVDTSRDVDVPPTLIPIWVP